MVLWNFGVCRIGADWAISQRIFALFGQLYNFIRLDIKILFIVQGMSIMEVRGKYKKVPAAAKPRQAVSACFSAIGIKSVSTHRLIHHRIP